MNQINLALIGPGLVGKEFLAQIKGMARYKVIGLMNSTKMSVNHEGIDIEEELKDLQDLDKFIASMPPDTIIIDSTSSSQIALAYPSILKTCHIITPNKKPFSSGLKLYKQIKSLPKFCYHESSVGAGLPILSTLDDLILSKDEVFKIEGILSGTLSYIFNTFTNSSEGFSEIVRVAKEKGFTEPDPRDDLNGMDVARKIVILARGCGLDIEIEDVHVENIVPKDLRGLGVCEFMEMLPSADQYFQSQKELAAKEGKVLRYVGSIENRVCKVELKRYDKSHAFANLNGSDNVVAITTKRFPNPLIIQGAGAGAEVTAFGMVSDLIKISKVLVGGPII